MLLRLSQLSSSRKVAPLLALSILSALTACTNGWYGTASPGGSCDGPACPSGYVCNQDLVCVTSESLDTPPPPPPPAPPGCAYPTSDFDACASGEQAYVCNLDAGLAPAGCAPVGPVTGGELVCCAPPSCQPAAVDPRCPASAVTYQCDFGAAPENIERYCGAVGIDENNRVSYCCTESPLCFPLATPTTANGCAEGTTPYACTDGGPAWGDSCTYPNDSAASFGVQLCCQ